MGTRNDPGVLPGRTNRIFGNEGADAEGGGTAPASDPRDGDEPASQHPWRQRYQTMKAWPAKHTLAAPLVGMRPYASP
jgi:hypothetical protein